MLSRAQEKIIRSLRTRKGRLKYDLCLVEGQKVIDSAGDAVQWTFTPEDTPNFKNLVSTESPQDIAGVAKVPRWTLEEVTKKDTIVVLDGVQDPGNIGSIFRLCQGFNASLLLINTARIANSKVIRSSVGAIFHVPWIRFEKHDAVKIIKNLDRPIFRMERREESTNIEILQRRQPAILIAGAEGSGIHIELDGISVEIPHRKELESLNVGHALAIALFMRYRA